jgi:TnpA family transposase
LDLKLDLPKDFSEKREYYYELLNLPLKAKEFIVKLKTSTANNLERLNANIPNNKLVQIKKSKVGNNIKLTPSDPQDEPDNIVKLQQEINNKYSSIHLIDILKECDLRINFTKTLETIGKSSSLNSSDLQKRLLLCIFGIGSNTGLKRISIANDGINYSDLRYVKKRHVNAVNIRNAIRILVNNVLKIRDPDVWGEATTTVACDSTHLFAWDQNLMSEWHFRYGKKGVMIYWHVDKKSLCIYSQLKDCSSSEVGSMIKGIIDHDTDMDINRVFIDTHGQSVIGFAVSYLLHFALYPRLKAINKQKLYYVDSKDKNKYTNIAEILKGSINWQLIEDNYDEMVKHMVALKLGIVTPSVLIKRFSNNNYSHPVYKALVELGKANKTIFLCQYLASEELRIEVNEGLNVVERLNSVMDFIFYGKLGQIATNNIEDQELSILCLHLLQVCMVYINTLIIQSILSGSHWQNKFTPKDYRALTPLFSGHINPYGLFPLDFSKRLSMIIYDINTYTG